jgi:hypothetical protein
MAGGLAALAIVGGVWLRTREQARPEAIVADAIVAPSPPAPQAMPLPPARVLGEAKQVVKLPQPPVLAGRQELALKKALAQAIAPSAANAPAPVSLPPLQKAKGLEALDSPRMGVMGGEAGAAAAPVARLAVEYTLLLKNAGGEYLPVPPDTVFHTGDSVRLRIEPRQSGAAALFRRDDAGAPWTLVAGRDVQKAQRYVLPATGGLQSDAPGQMDLMLELSQAADAAPATGAFAVRDEVRSTNAVSATPVPAAAGVDLSADRPAGGRASFRIVVRYR